MLVKFACCGFFFFFFFAVNLFNLLFSDYRKKQEYLRALRKKALEKNPDEFYYKMTRVKLQVSA